MMEIRHTTNDGVTVVHLVGEIWGRTGEPEQFRKTVGDIVDNGGTRVVFNLSGVRLISSIGLGMLIGAYKKITGAGGAMAVAEPADPIKPVFRVLKGPFEDFDSEADAIAHVKNENT